jgi:2-polyprenyl-3-methyl-5-hydroxy-6-metoxy-1,4-benzoquinol methylase
MPIGELNPMRRNVIVAKEKFVRERIESVTAASDLFRVSSPIAPAATESCLRYEFKPGPYSSHTLILDEFPAWGDGLRVLDLGCAGGHLAVALAKRGYSVTGVDLPGAPQPAGIDFIEANLDHGLPHLDEPFDYILCADILEHLRDPLSLLRECRKHLGPNGVLIGSLPNSGNLYFRLQVLMGRFPQDDRGLFDRTHLHFYTWDGWKQLLAAGGFGIDRRRCSGIPVGLALKNSDSLPARAMERFSFQLAHLWRRGLAYQFVVRAKPLV